MSGRRAKERKRITIAPVQEREEEEKGQARNEMPIEFPQQFLLVDGIPALVYRMIRGGLLDLCRYFLFGHGWREKRGRGEDRRGDEPFYGTKEWT